MSKNRDFDFLESIYMPVVVCTKKGRIVSRNRYADVISALPGNGLSIEAAAEPESEGSDGIRFRRLRRDAGAFRTALLFPVFTPSGGEYVGWLFDVAFQLADTERLQALLSAYGGFSLSAEAVRDTVVSERAAFRRFCGSVYPALLTTVSGHRVADMRYACRTLLYSLRGLLDGFGLRTELSLPDSYASGTGVDYSALVMSTIHLLIFVLSKSRTDRFSASVTEGEGSITVEFEVSCASDGDIRGGFAELEAAFPDCAAMIAIISASFAGREDGFSFERAHGRLSVRFTQKTFEYSARALRQHGAKTDISALLVLAAMVIAAAKDAQ